jgi:hypothetical protein
MMSISEMTLMSYSIGFGLLGLFVAFVACALATPTKDEQHGELIYPEDEE